MTTAFLGSFWSGSQVHEVKAQNSLCEPPPLNTFEEHYQASVLRGWKIFQTSFAADGIACVNCHTSHQDIARWAGAYPKTHVFDGTAYRVKTLRQVVAEAFDKHSDLPYKKYDRMIDETVSYISWWGYGQRVQPGYSETIPPADRDLLQLQKAVERGELFFYQKPLSCVNCHVGAKTSDDSQRIPVGNAFITFPRYEKDMGKVVPLENFLRNHLISQLDRQGLDKENTLISDIAAYLASLAEGQAYRPGEEIIQR